MIPISASTARELLTGCPYRLFLRKVLGIEQPDSEPSQNGRILHTAAERYVKYLYENGKQSDEEKYLEILSEEILTAGYLANPEAITDFGRKFVQNFSLDIEKVIAVEHKVALTKDFQPTEWDAENVAHRGAIDIIQRISASELYVQDYKFTWKTEHDDKIQMEYYAMLLFSTMPEIETITCSFWLIGRNIETEELTYKRKQLKALQDKYTVVYNMLQGIVEKGLEPIKRPSYTYCGYCSNIEECIKEYDDIINPNRKDIANKIILHSAIASKLEKEIEKMIQADEWLTKKRSAISNPAGLLNELIALHQAGELELEKLAKVISVTTTGFNRLPKQYKEAWKDMFLTTTEQRDKKGTYKKIADGTKNVEN